MIEKAEIQSFEIRFETSENTPPPYSYAYMLKGELKETLTMSYEVQYTHREDLSLDEILGEGFSINDDLVLEGTIEAVWTAQILQLLDKTKPSKHKGQANDNFFEIELTDGQGERKALQPHNQEEWEYLCEELSQALLEAQQVERPLLLTFKKISSTENIDFQFFIEFVKRRVSLKTKPKKGVSKEIELSWEAGKDFLELVFKPDYFEEDAQVYAPTHNGFFINLGDENWYESGKSLMNRSQKVDMIGKIEKKLNDFLI
jgi:hypothetical protein